MKSSITIVIASFITIIGFPIHASADGSTATIAVTSDAAPDSNGSLSIFGTPSLNLNGQVAFGADLVGTSGGSADNQGIFLGSGGVLTQIVRKGETAPDSNGSFSIFSNFRFAPALNANGQVVFRSFLSGTSGGSADNRGIFGGSGGALTQIARTGQAVPDGNGNFSDLIYNRVLNASGQVAFGADLVGTLGGNADDSGIYRDSGGALTQIAREGQAVPGGNGNLSTLTNANGINVNGQVVFDAFLTGTSNPGSDSFGLYRGSGGALTQIVRQGQTAPDGNGSFSITGGMGINASGQVVFQSSLFGTSGGSTDNSGIFRGSGGAITQIARAGQAALDGNGNLSTSFSTPQINASGQAAFSSGLTGTSGGTTDDTAIYLGSGGTLTQIMREGQLAPDGNGLFFGAGTPALNTGGQVAFMNLLTGTSGGTTDDRGIYLGDGQELVQAIRKGDALAGSTVVNLFFSFGNSEQSGLNDYGQIAYLAHLSDGREGIFLFTPDLHWRRSGSGNWSNRTNWTVGLDPAQVHDVLIDPGSALTVLGPAGAETVKSLTIGGGAGTATLRLQPSTLTATNGVTIADTGILTGTGSVNAALTNNGTLAPGNSPGILTITGDYTQSSTGTYAVEIGGLLAGTEYDVLNVSGTATLAGTLDVSLFDLGGGLFAPSLGDSFDILSADILSGQFDVLSLASLGSGLSWNLSYLIDAIGSTDIVRLSVTSAVPVPPAVWLFGSGLLGLMVITRRRRMSSTVQHNEEI